MLVWRVCRKPFADLSGEGGRFASGRWHSAGRPVVYTAYEPALAILEVRVHLDIPFEDVPEDYVLMGIDLSRLAAAEIEMSETLPAIGDARAYGDAWLASARSAVLAVPSVLAPRGRNYLLNPLHPDARKIEVAEVLDFKFDGRLWG